MLLLRSTDLALLRKLLLGVLVLGLASSRVLAEDSQLAGAWTLVEGRKQITFQGHSHEENLPPWDEHRPFVVINADGSLDVVQGGGFAQLDRLRHKGDRIVSPGGVAGYIEVEDCRYNPDSCELKLLCHDKEKNLDYRVSFQLRLMPNGLLSYHHILPYPGVGKEIVTATLKRIQESQLPSIQGLVREFKGHHESINAVVFSPQGSHLLSGGRDHTVRLWKVDTGDEVRRFVGHQRPVSCVAFSPDGRLAVSGTAESRGARSGERYSVRVWEVETGDQIHQLKAFKYVTSVSFSPDSQFVLASGGITDSRYEKEPVTALLWNVESGKLVSELFNQAGKVRSAAFSPDGLYVLCAPIAPSSFKRFCLHDAQKGQRIRVFGERGLAPDTVCFSPDGQRILTSGRDEFIREWAVESGEVIHRIQPDGSAVLYARYLPDGRHVLSVSHDHMIQLWDMETERELGTPHQLPGRAKAIAASPDGRHVVSGGDDGILRLWNPFE